MAKIMVASAETGIRTFLATGLESAGHDVFTATCPEDMLDLIAEERFDVMIADVFQPVLEGVALVATIARVCRTMRIIAITDFTTARAHTYDLGLWVDTSMAKPISMTRVSNEIDWVLASPRVRAPVSA